MCKFISVAATLAVSACASDTTAPIIGVPAAPSASTALALGQLVSCALTTNLTAYCWGDGAQGQLGDSTRSSTVTPTATAGAHQYVAIAVGSHTACALDRGGVAWCWGEDPTQPGVVGASTATAVRISAPSAFASISVGRKFACGLTTTGKAYCWGENQRGQLGVGDTLVHKDVQAVSGNIRFASLSAGFWHVCGVDGNGVVYCWGDNQFAELATGETNTRFVAAPQRIAGPQTFASVSSGSVHTCALTSAGAAYCWGSNSAGHLGDGTSTFRLTPTPVATTLTFTMLRATRANDVFSHTCGITSSGDVYCWGYNAFGQLGPANTQDECINSNTGAAAGTCSYTPVKVAGVSNVKALDVGDGHTCALTATSQLLCWGLNASGQLGDGTTTNRATPGAVIGALTLP